MGKNETIQLGESGRLSPSQIRALKVIRELAKVIINQYPQAADEYRQGFTYAQIARKHLNDTRRAASVAVGEAMKELIPDDKERERLFKEKMTKIGQSSPELSPEGLSVLQQSMRRCNIKQDKIPWITDLIDPVSQLNEPDFLLNLADNPEFIIQKGSRKGHPDCFKIAKELNKRFHQGEEIRSPKSVSTKLARLQSRQD